MSFPNSTDCSRFIPPSNSTISSGRRNIIDDSCDFLRLLVNLNSKIERVKRSVFNVYECSLAVLLLKLVRNRICDLGKRTGGEP